MKRSYIIGLDTGGTFTDGVIVDRENRSVLCKSKALTSRPDLSVGIRECLAGLDPELLGEAGLVCLSTTLATNAIVEGYGSSVGLLTINPGAEGNRFGADKVVSLPGQMDIKGNELVALDEDAVREGLRELRGQVEAIAVSGFASVRNPAHEHQVRQIVRETLDLPVVCGCELTNVLGYEERTVTAVLNARLISRIRQLILAVTGILNERGIDVPLMVVKGDGSLMSADLARERPIETIMSGPAASVIGGLFLSGRDDGIVVDIGGTTTDIAQLRGRRVSLCADGAVVGGWQTRVKAIRMHTHGLGGDSWCRISEDGSIRFGPRRVVPLCIAAQKDPQLTEELDRYRRNLMYEPGEIFWTDCVRLSGRKDPEDESLGQRDRKLLGLLQSGAHSVFYLEEKIGKKVKYLGLRRLQRGGWIEKCSLTPTDLLHAEGSFLRWNAEASEAAVRMVSSRLGISEAELIRRAKKQFTDQLSFDIASSVLQFGGEHGSGQREHETGSGEHVSGGPGDLRLLRQAIEGSGDSLLDLSIRLRSSLVGLGAPTGAWLPDVRGRMETEIFLPEHYEVANAVGAAAGEIHEEIRMLIQFDPFRDRFLVFLPGGRQACKSLEQAIRIAKDAGERECRQIAGKQMLEDYEITIREDIRYRDPLDECEFDILDSFVTVILTGNPLKIS